MPVQGQPEFQTKTCIQTKHLDAIDDFMINCSLRELKVFCPSVHDVQYKEHLASFEVVSGFEQAHEGCKCGSLLSVKKEIKTKAQVYREKTFNWNTRKNVKKHQFEEPTEAGP